MDIYKKSRQYKKRKEEGNHRRTQQLIDYNKTRRQLTPEQAKEIRELYYTEVISCKKIAKIYGCKDNIIYNLVKYKTYADCGGMCCYDCRRILGNDWDCVVPHVG